MLLGIRWRSLRAKIIAWSFVPTAIILAAVAWVTFIAYQQVTEDLVMERDQKLTRLSAGEFAAGLNEYTSLLTEYAGLLSGLPRAAYAFEGDLIVRQDLLERARSRFSVFDGGVLILDSQGTVVATQPERPSILGENWSGRPYFRQMLRSLAPFFSDIVPDGPDGAEVIAVAVPLRGDQGQFLGMIVGMFRLGPPAFSSFSRGLSGLRVGEGGSTYLVDGSGRVIYHTDLARIGDDFSERAIVQKVLVGETGALRDRDLEGRAIVASFAPVPGTSWGLVTEAIWSELMRSSRGYQRFLLLLLVLGVVVPAIVVAVGVGRITQPISALIDAAQQVASGNFGQTISARTGDEIEDLAQQFNRMAAQLQESYAHLEQRVAARTRELAALNAIAAVVSQSLDLEEILKDALDKTLQVMEIEAGGIYLLDDDAGVLHIAAHRGFDQAFIADVDRLEVGEGFSGHVVQTGEPLVVNNASIDPRLTRIVVREHGVHSVAVVPLGSKGRVLGTLFTGAMGYREFSAQDIQLLTSIGQQIGMAVDNAQLFMQAEQRMRELEALYHADEKMRRHLHLEQVLRALVDVTVDILHADKSAVLIWDPGSRRWVVRVARGFSPEAIRVLSFAYEEGIVGQVATKGEPAVVEDVLADPRRARERPETVRAVDEDQIRSFMLLPIQIDGQVFGVFNVSFAEPRAFGRDERRLFLALAQRAALVIEKAQLYEQAQELAVLEERGRLARDLHDAVTQTLFSASLIAEILPDLWASDQEEGRQLLAELRQLSRGALAEMRTLLLELRPAALVEANLADLLRQLAEAVTGREGVPVTVTVESHRSPARQSPALPPEVHVALYRIAQEALNNVVKHAQASHVQVSLRCAEFTPSSSPFGRERCGEQVELCIADDGRGFDLASVPQDRLGLGIIRERAESIGASLTIESGPASGTQVKVVWQAEVEPMDAQPPG